MERRTNPPGAEWHLPLGVRGRKAPHESRPHGWGLSLPSLALDTRFPAGMTRLRIN
ncbi:MAG: hypothetical protein PHY16_09770 [Methylobacter sp.]|nr:hypothetical protein [Methylobacter sp.]